MEDRFIQCVTHLAKGHPSPNDFVHYLKFVYKHITKLYSHESRFYHTFGHIEYMIENLDKYFTNLLSETEKAKVELAILFHDIIYDVSYSPGINELLSAEFFKQFGVVCDINKDIINEISELIMSTTHTQELTTLNKKIICDLDLLGLSGPVYWTNREKVLTEYTQEFTSEEFLEGRLKFLNWMLDKETIFHTGFFQKYFEEGARINLETEKSNNYE